MKNRVGSAVRLLSGGLFALVCLEQPGQYGRWNGVQRNLVQLPQAHRPGDSNPEVTVSMTEQWGIQIPNSTFKPWETRRRTA